jgi:hypothetical protein
MADIVANPVEICFSSFTTTSTALAVTFLATVVKIQTTPVTVPIFDQDSKTHPPKPYDIVQGMERVIDMMKETLQIASHCKTFPFGLRPPSDAYIHQAAKSSQIQSGRRESSGNLKTELRTRGDPLNILCSYHKGARHTLRGCQLWKKIDQERAAPRTTCTPTSPDGDEF